MTDQHPRPGAGQPHPRPPAARPCPDGQAVPDPSVPDDELDDAAFEGEGVRFDAPAARAE